MRALRCLDHELLTWLSPLDTTQPLSLPSLPSLLLLQGLLPICSACLLTKMALNVLQVHMELTEDAVDDTQAKVDKLRYALLICFCFQHYRIDR